MRLAESTGLAQAFVATRPLNDRRLFFRFGVSAEAGNRQTDLPQTGLPASVVARSGYGSLKMYAGATLGSRRNEWKASYGLELGNSGRGVRVDFVKQIFDTAYTGRFLPSPHMPMQFDARFSAGTISAVGGGSMPAAERFFGGNVERDFIEGDSWRISSDPFIRSFLQGRLNRTESGVPIGGNDFIAFNLTASQTIWSTPLLPQQVARDADMKAALGAQLLNTRKFLREAPIHQSGQMKALIEKIGKLSPPSAGKEGQGPVDILKTTLGCPAPDSDSTDPVSDFPPEAQELASTLCTEVSDAQDSVESADLPPDDDKAVIENEEQATKFINNPVEFQARVLAVGVPVIGVPDADQPPVIGEMRKNTRGLRAILETALSAPDTTPEMATKLRAAIATLSALSREDNSGTLDKSQADILSGLADMKKLREYRMSELQPMLDVLNQPDGAGRTLDGLLDGISQQLKPVRDAAKAELDETQKKLAPARAALIETQKKLQALASNSPDRQKLIEQEAKQRQEVTPLEKKKEELEDFIERIDVVTTYAGKAKASHKTTNLFVSQQLTDEVKYSIELLAVGFGGGSPAHLTGVAEGVDDLREPFSARRLDAQWDKLKANADAVVSFQDRVRPAFRKLQIPKYEREANKTVFFVGDILDSFFKELNLLGVSHVLMLDAARIRQTDIPGGESRFRYGIGSGLRFSLVNLDFTAGYSINPHRLPGEGRGAFVFSMEINNLFR